MRYMRFAMFSLLVSILAFSTTAGRAQTPPASVVTIPKGQPITLGFAGDLSMQALSVSQGVLYAMKVAVNRRNAAGGIKGFQIEVVSKDDQCEANQAPGVARTLIQLPRLVGVIGHICSSATIPASEVYETARVVMVSASSTANAVTARGLTVINRAIFNDDNQALGDALYLYNVLNVRKAALLDDSEPYGQGLIAAVKREFTRLGGTVTFTGSVDPQVVSYSETLGKLRNDPPDVVFYGGLLTAGARLTTQLKENGLNKTLFFGGDGILINDYIQLTGADSNGMYGSAVSQEAGDAAALKRFADEFASTFNVTYTDFNPYQPNGYDATALLLDALDRVAVVDSATGGLTIDREALIKAVRATKNFKGLTGLLNCDSKGECGTGEVAISQVKKGQWQRVKVYSVADLAAAAAPIASPTP